jgi:hypothetical protein
MFCGVATPDGCEPAHQNGVSAGKGFGIKAHDNRHAAICHSCHADYDQGPMPRDEKFHLWVTAHLKTMDYYWQQGWLQVTGR